MDMLTLAMAKKYSDSKGGYVEDSVELTANASAMEGQGESFIQLSKETYDLNRIASVTLSTPDGERTFKKADLTIMMENGIQVAEVLGIHVVIVMPGLGTGGYCNEEKGQYVSKVVLDGTIVPIDPKFLPGVCLPVVEIADMSAITAEESAKLTACIGTPCIVNLLDGVLVGIAIYAIENGVHSFNLLGLDLIARSEDGTTWEWAE